MQQLIWTTPLKHFFQSTQNLPKFWVIFFSFKIYHLKVICSSGNKSVKGRILQFKVRAESFWPKPYVPTSRHKFCLVMLESLGLKFIESEKDNVDINDACTSDVSNVGAWNDAAWNIIFDKSSKKTFTGKWLGHSWQRSRILYQGGPGFEFSHWQILLNNFY